MLICPYVKTIPYGLRSYGCGHPGKTSLDQQITNSNVSRAVWVFLVNLRSTWVVQNFRWHMLQVVIRENSLVIGYNLGSAGIYISLNDGIMPSPWWQLLAMVDGAPTGPQPQPSSMGLESVSQKIMPFTGLCNSEFRRNWIFESCTKGLVALTLA